MTTFLNPIVPQGEDPWITFKDGWYYYCFVVSDEKRAIYVTKSRTISNIQYGKRVMVWNPPVTGDGSTQVWAPELHFINGHWYIYYAAGDETGKNHKMYVLESINEDAQGLYEFKGKIADINDGWGIDGTILRKDDGELYYIWSGTEHGLTGGDEEVQDLYISKLANPWTMTGPRVCISRPELPWELIGPAPVNEGPAVLYRNGKFIVVYSASHSLTDDYCLGALINDTGDVMNPDAWKKLPEPVFKKNEVVFGPGHASFTTSADGAEDWIIYHTALHSGAGWRRQVQAQKYSWVDDIPAFGMPTATDREVALPSGEQTILAQEQQQGSTVHTSISLGTLPAYEVEATIKPR